MMQTNSGHVEELVHINEENKETIKGLQQEIKAFLQDISDRVDAIETAVKNFTTIVGDLY
ncbi:hypothetical protein HUT03_04395 [Candidatus Liberibacter africanus]|uniref:hypothetical protein n=1 Tax=Liberibacter africanus TaxID=34020 RepID=UPI0006412D70|nr:hypothetical protein [Candidatus Liberibacter africanus]QTP64199.1 hypothetical protein HUT03_04395 [Candidatus Liberibacter africanus]